MVLKLFLKKIIGLVKQLTTRYQFSSRENLPLVFLKVFETNQNSRFFDSRIFKKPKVTVL